MPRIHILIHFSSSVFGKITAGSFPPSSRVTGVRFSVAAMAICRRVILEPRNQTNSTYLASDGLRANKGDVFDERRLGKRICIFRPTAYQLYGHGNLSTVRQSRTQPPHLNQLRIVSARHEAVLDNVDEPA